jgi:adenylate cyclase
MRRFKWASFVPLLLLVAALLLRIADPLPTVSLRNFAFDTFERLRPRAYVDAGIRVIDIDDETLARIGQWPWPRTEVARLLERLNELGAAAIAFDGIFPEPDRTSPKNILPVWRQQTGTVLPPSLTETLPDHDDLLARTLARTRTVLGITLTNTGGARPEPHWGIALAGNDVRPFLVPFDGTVGNLPVLEARAAGLGTLNSVPDIDGVVRRVPLIFTLRGGRSVGEGVYPSLSAEALRVAQAGSTYVIKGTGASGYTAFGQDVGVNSLVIGDLAIPTDGAGRIALYDTGFQTGRTIPAWQILDPGFDRERIAGTIAFVGIGAAGLYDNRTTPLRALAAGVEIHAQIAEQIVTGVLLHRPNWMMGAELGWMVLLCGLLLWALRRVGPIWAAGLGAYRHRGRGRRLVARLHPSLSAGRSRLSSIDRAAALSQPIAAALHAHRA